MSDPRRSVIGLITSPTDFAYSNGLVAGMTDLLEPRGVQLVTYVLIYDSLDQSFSPDVMCMLDTSRLDGLAIGGSLANDLSRPDYEQLCRSLASIPLVTINTSVEGLTAVMPDGDEGMKELMAHLLDHHGYTKLAFIGGPKGHEEAASRHRIFIEELDRRGLHARDEWLEQGNFQPYSGEEAMERLLAKGPIEFDAVVVANDEMAFAAIDCLKFHGYRVPEDVAVVGFDDAYNYMLTSVKQSSVVLGRAAAATLLTNIYPETTVPTPSTTSSLTVRSSCGCLPGDRLAILRESEGADNDLSALIKDMETAFRKSLEQGDDGIFLSVLQAWVADQASATPAVLWFSLGAHLYEQVVPEMQEKGMGTEAGALMMQGAYVFMDSPHNAVSREFYNSMYQVALLKDFNARLANTIKLDEALNIFTQDLPKLGVKSCFVSLFVESVPDHSQASLVYALQATQRVDIKPYSVTFPTVELCPPHMYPAGSGDELLLVEPLYSKRKHIGFALLSVTQSGCRNANAIAMHIANSIQNIRLWRERNQSEQQLVESAKMAALGSLVAGVAHEINTPIGIGLTTANDIGDNVRELKAAHEGRSLTLSKLNDYIDLLDEESGLIERNLTRAAGIIQSFKRIAVDQSAEAPRSFGLKEYLHDLVSSMHAMLAKRGNVCEIDCPDDLELYGQAGSIAQVFTNLITNSLTHGFVDGRQGLIRIVCRQDNTQVHIRYEDNGRGIPPEVMHRIFEPFFTTSRRSGGSGLGLHIVYNHIVKDWQGSIKCTTPDGPGVRFDLTLTRRVGDILPGTGDDWS